MIYNIKDLKKIYGEEFNEKDINWELISGDIQLSEDFIRKYSHELYWVDICIYQKLSTNFMMEHEEYIDFQTISEYQELSEEFIKKYKDKLNWDCICKFQKLSKEFIIEMIDYIDIFYLEMNVHIIEKEVINEIKILKTLIS